MAALASNPVVATAAPHLHAFALRYLPDVRPDVAAQLQAVAELQQQQAALLAAVQQLAGIPCPGSALASACCRDVQQQLPALELLPAQGCKHVVATILTAAAQHASTPPAVALSAALLLHPQPSVRHAALATAAQLEGGAAAALVVQPAVAAALALALGDEPPRQQLAAGLLQSAVAGAASSSCGAALLPWEAWLLCHASHPAVGPAVASALQLVCTRKQSTWQRVTPLLLALFHASPAVAAEAANQLHMLLVQHRPAAAGAMLFNPLPFDGMLLPAGSGGSGSLQLASSPVHASRVTAGSAAKLFTAADVQSLLAVAGNPSLPAELAAAALGQLSQVASDPRFAGTLASEPGGFLSSFSMVSSLQVLGR